MGFRFYRRVRLLPGISVNLSRSGPSLSVGVRGAHVTMGRRGVTRTAGIPGTGIFYTSRQGYHTGAHHVPSVPASPTGHAGTGCGAVILAGLAVLLGLVVLLPWLSRL